MTTASEIKKTLNAHFKGQKIKFSVTTRRVSCAHEISVEWVGGAFENEVWEVVKGFHTLVDKSDGMTDYFFMSGVNVVLKRRYDDADIEFLTHCFNTVACSNEEIVVEQYTDKIGGYYISFNRDGYWLSYCNHPHHLMVFRQYNKTGAISEDACIPEVVEETNECDLLNGNKTQQNNEILKAKEELIEVMKQMKEYLDIQIEILMNFEPEKQPERLQSLDQEFGIELLKRRKDKLQKRIMAHK